MRKLVCLIAFLTAFVGWTAAASAQFIDDVVVDRTGDTFDSPFTFYISKANCDADEIFTFDYRATLSSDLSLQVWVSDGADCSLDDERNGDDAECVRILFEDNPDDEATIEIGAATIANAHETIEGCIDTGASTEPHDTEIWFLLVDNDSEDVADGFASVVTTAKVDVLGPDGRDIEAVKPADSAVTLDLASSNDDDKFRAFCFPKAADFTGDDSTGGSSPQSNPQGLGGGAVGGGGASAGGASAGGSSPGGGGAGGGTGGAGG
ncbi:MAG: hypothetical protein HOW73_00045, partial [Polyangiaceae bacterium]|nr:hypothetical protein [Polyangiaceae bacterium]